MFSVGGGLGVAASYMLFCNQTTWVKMPPLLAPGAVFTLLLAKGLLGKPKRDVKGIGVSIIGGHRLNGHRLNAPDQGNSF